VGDIVKKGQVVGKMGSSGRSTGPHVHYEVYKNGRVVDPSSYVQRASR
jgi:murein DD-endopeptidase MepM/ murein hydrolase activator NlpD